MILFTEFDILEKYRKSFHESELDRLHSVFPFKSMAKACPITNYKIVSVIRNKMASRLDIGPLQKVPASHWEPCLENLLVCMTDATCYNTYKKHEYWVSPKTQLHSFFSMHIIS